MFFTLPAALTAVCDPLMFAAVDYCCCCCATTCQMGTGGNHTLSTMDLSYSIQITDKDTKVTNNNNNNHNNNNNNNNNKNKKDEEEKNESTIFFSLLTPTCCSVRDMCWTTRFGLNYRGWLLFPKLPACLKEMVSCCGGARLLYPYTRLQQAPFLCHVMPMSCYLYVLLLQEKVSKTLIHPVTFNIKPTEMVAIMGASGAGKSTMLDVLAQRVPFSQASRTQPRPVDYAGFLS